MKKSSSLTVKLFLALVLLTSGILWLVSSTTDAFLFNAGAFWSSIAIGLGLVFALCATFEKSAGYGFLFALFFVNGIVFILGAYAEVNEALSLSLNWPFNISSLAFGAFILSIDKNTNVKFHIKNAIVISALTILLYIANIGLVEWVIIIPILAILFAGNIVLGVISNRNSNDEIESESYEEFEKNSEKG